MYSPKKVKPSASAHHAFELNGGLLHRRLLLPIAILAVFYTVVNVWLGLHLQAYLAISVVPATAIAWWLDNIGLRLISQFFIFLVVILVILLIGIVAPKDTYIYLFYFPISLGALIIFQGRKKWIGYVISFVSFLIILFLLILDRNEFVGLRTVKGDVEIERMTNVIGVFIFVLLELRYLMRINEHVQSDLMDKKVKLDQSVERLKSSIFVRERMMSILAHDVRSPLASVQAFLELLESEGLSQEERKSMMEMLKAQTDKTSKMVNDVVQWARSQMDSISSVPVRMSYDELYALIISVSAMFELPYERGEIVVHKEVTESGFISVDRNMMESIMRNLISNAVKFTNDDRLIEITLQETKIGIRVEVADNGMGISEENMEKIRQGISFTTSNQSRLKGIGLGNQIVQDFLHRHDTQIEVSSTLGEGSVFAFELHEIA
jgi:signal transduction histidine kinase